MICSWRVLEKDEVLAEEKKVLFVFMKFQVEGRKVEKFPNLKKLLLKINWEKFLFFFFPLSKLMKFFLFIFRDIFMKWNKNEEM